VPRAAFPSARGNAARHWLIELDLGRVGDIAAMAATIDVHGSFVALARPQVDSVLAVGEQDLFAGARRLHDRGGAVELAIAKAVEHEIACVDREPGTSSAHRSGALHVGCGERGSAVAPSCCPGGGSGTSSTWQAPLCS
jgi:hypothetical protein